MTPPTDWESPQWCLNSSYPNHWHNYTSVELRASWDSFDSEQKKIIASCLNEIAENEDWD